MNAVRIVRTFAIVAVIAGGVMLAGNTQAEAGNHYNNSYKTSYNNSHNTNYNSNYNAPRTQTYQPTTYRTHQPVCNYKKVTKFEYRTQRYTSWVTKYKPCGTAYRVQVVRTKVVKVPVIKWVKVCH